ncbi:hypothetical protein D3C75_1239830 [compost metagenome]
MKRAQRNDLLGLRDEQARVLAQLTAETIQCRLRRSTSHEVEAPCQQHRLLITRMLNVLPRAFAEQQNLVTPQVRG